MTEINRNSAWMIYGANGYTGRLVTASALSQDERPILAGRSRAALASMANPLGLSWRAFSLEDPETTEKALSGVKVLVNLSGPFLQTSENLARACINTGVHYLDISNEIPSLQAVYSLDTMARQRESLLLPGIGFGTTASNCLSKYLHDCVPEADWLDIVVAPQTETRSVGAGQSVLQAIRGGGYVRRDHHLLRHRLGKGSRRVELPVGRRTIVPAPLGDLEAAYRVTGIANITAHMMTGLPPHAANLVFGMAQHLAQMSFTRSVAAWLRQSDTRTAVRDPLEGPAVSLVWARIGRLGEVSQEAWLTLGEGYRFTADSVVSAVRRIVDGPIKLSGAHTPASVFGADFVLGIPGVNRQTGAIRLAQ